MGFGAYDEDEDTEKFDVNYREDSASYGESEAPGQNHKGDVSFVNNQTVDQMLEQLEQTKQE